MNDEGALARRPRPQLDSLADDASGLRGRLAWADVDRDLEVRARLVVILDALECGDYRYLGDVLVQLLDELDRAEWILRPAA